MILITQPRVGRSHNEIIALQMAAESLGWEVYPSEYSWRLPDELIASGKVGVPYGSQLFCETIAQQMGWTLLLNSFDWLAKLPFPYVQRKVEFMPLGESMKLSETKFIKPADDKIFEAKIYAPGELIPFDSISMDTPTLVSDIVKFDLEYRCFVENNRVRTWSNYICHENLAEPKYWNFIDANDACMPHEFVQDMLWDEQDIMPPTSMASVIDVGRIEGGGFAIIESNPAWASGLYGCDPVVALKVMKAACRRVST